MNTGFGVIAGCADERRVLANTVADTERGAMVNWLVTHRRIVMMHGVTDEIILHHWRVETEGMQVHIGKVRFELDRLVTPTLESMTQT